MKDSIGRILVSEQQLLEKIKELGKRITEDYQGRDLLLVPRWNFIKRIRMHSIRL